MPSRRQFLGGSLAAAGALVAGGKLLSNPKSEASVTAPLNKVVRVGTQLQLNGNKYLAIGCDIWPMAVNSWSHPGDYNGNSIAQLAGYLSDIHATAPHINAIRVWTNQQFALNGGNFDYSTFDTLLATCDAAGVKVVMSLEDNWSYERAGTQLPQLTTAWFNGGYTNTVLTAEQIPYRQWVSQTVTRYAQDPRILFWELVNEPNNITGTFVNDMCALIHSIDPVTPISDGAGYISNAYYNVSNGFDIMDWHYYTDYGQTNWQAIQANAAAAGVPWYFGEMGADTSLGGPGQASRVSALMSASFAFTNTAGFLYWQFTEIAGDQFKIGAGNPVLAVMDSYVLSPPPTPPPPPPPPVTPPPTPTPTPAFLLPTYFSATPYWNTINLGWGASPNAQSDTSYRVQVMTGQRIINDFKTMATHAHITNLRQNTTYKWRIQVSADSNHLASPWSSWRSVTTK